MQYGICAIVLRKEPVNTKQWEWDGWVSYVIILEQTILRFFPIDTVKKCLVIVIGLVVNVITGRTN